MSDQEVQAALQYAGRLALQTDPYVIEKIQSPGTQVLAAGSLFNYGILPLVSDKKVASAAELEQAVKKMVSKTDAELPGGSLVEVAVSNPVLVLGYMQALQIPQVEVVKVNNADGALTYPPYWE